MSEKTYVEIETIPLSATLDIKVSGEFLARINQFITGFFPFKDKEHFAELINHIKNNTNQEDPFVYHLKTLIGLQAHIENAAKEQKVTKMIKVDKETGKPIEEETQPGPQS